MDPPRGGDRIDARLAPTLLIGLALLDQTHVALEHARRRRQHEPRTQADRRPDTSRDRRFGPAWPAPAPPAACRSSRSRRRARAAPDACSTMYGIWRSAASTTRRSENPRDAPALCASTPASRPSATRPALPAGTARDVLEQRRRRARRRRSAAPARRRRLSSARAGRGSPHFASATVWMRTWLARRFEVVARRGRASRCRSARSARRPARRDRSTAARRTRRPRRADRAADCRRRRRRDRSASRPGGVDRQAQRRRGDAVADDAPQRGLAEQRRHQLRAGQLRLKHPRVRGASDSPPTSRSSATIGRLAAGQPDPEAAAPRLARAPLEDQRRGQRRRSSRAAGTCPAAPRGTARRCARCACRPR